jgi:thiosulfate dehydrogenase (quinone) large subunit
MKYSKPQLTFLVILRLLIGWHFLYEGISKVLKPGWSSAGYLMDSGGPLEGFFHWMAGNPGMMNVVDFMNVWGLVAIGLGLILGLFTRTATIAGIALLALYYLSHPPLIGITYALPSEGNYLIVNKNLIEIFALAVLFVFPSGKHFGFDSFICRKKGG